MIHEEKTLESEMIYEGKILNLRKDKVTIKNGKTSTREIIEHNGGAVIVPITKDKEIILIKQFRKPLERVIIETPAGKIEKGEDPFETVKRELREETGYSAKKYDYLGKTNPCVGYCTETLYIYAATELEEGETEFDEGEDIELLKVPFEEAYKMCINGEIEDAKTIVSIFLAKEKIAGLL